MSIWKQKSDCEDKPWGGVVHIATPFGMKGKIIYLNEGQRTSLKYYNHMDQALYCLSGELIVTAPNEYEFGDEISRDKGAKFNITPGEVLLIQHTNPYRITAKEDSVLVEVLLGSRSGGGKVMIEDDYGRV